MTDYLFDAAYRPNLDRVKSAGGICMSVYLTGMYSGTCAQPSELHAKGLGALANYEEGASELVNTGYSGGVSIGERAAQGAVSKGFPANAGKGIAFSLDVDTPYSAFPGLGQTFKGIGHGLAGRFVPLVYGEGAAIDYLWNNHEVAGVEWLAAPTSWAGFNPGDIRVGVVQQVGSPVGGTDIDRITNLQALAPLIWWPAGSSYDKKVDDVSQKDVIDALNSAEGQAALQKAVWEMKISRGSGSPEYYAQSWLTGAGVYAGETLKLAKDVDTAVQDLAKQVQALHTATGSTGSIDPAALAQAIAAHIQLAVK